MNRLSTLAILFILPCYITNASEQNVQFGSSSSTEDTTDSTDFFDPLNSEEAYDPQKDYANFKDFKNYEKLYRMSGPPLLPQPLQQKQWQFQQQTFNSDSDDGDDVDEASTDPNIQSVDVDSDNDDGMITTTNPPQSEPQTTIKFIMDGAPNVINEIVKNTPRPIDTIIESASNAELVLNKQQQTQLETMVRSDLENDAKTQLEKENGIQKEAVIFNDDNFDYVNDSGNENFENNDTNYSQPITLPYLMDTTITSLPSSPVFISTRPPIALFTTSSSTTTTASAIVSNAHAQANSVVAPNQMPGKKSAKKIEAVPRVYKYSADEILRKYLDDTFIRAPMATLINTAPEPLRKGKQLWKAALRPNTPIDIVLVAFNSSGKILN